MHFDFTTHTVVGRDETVERVDPALMHTAPRTAAQFRLSGEPTPVFALDPGEEGRRYVTNEAIARWEEETRQAEQRANIARLMAGGQ